MKEYIEICEEVIQKGTWKESARPGMPCTLSRFGITKRFDLQKGFPLLTTKKMFFKGIVCELVWFLRGDTNIKYLVDNNVHIWDKYAHDYYLKKCLEYPSYKPLSLKAFIEQIKHMPRNSLYLFPNYDLGDTGWTYGRQWVNFGGYSINQITNLINDIEFNPSGRYKVISAWHPYYNQDCALPPCHMLSQFNCRPISPTDPNYIEGANRYYIDCKMTQRSCDLLLGVPFNIASYALLTHVIADMTNNLPGDFIWDGNDVHIYEAHLPAILEQIQRQPYPLPTINIKSHWSDVSLIEPVDFEIQSYQCHPAIKGELY